MAARQIHVVMGKGGVGKSMTALALALGLWRQGKRVLLCQVHTADAHGPLLGVTVGQEVTEARPNLHVVNIEPASARREYVMMILKFRTLYDAVFENRFTQYFLRFIPSLAELNITGKIWFHAQETEGTRRKYDHIVVDAPATGHGVTLMKVARVISATAPNGPLKQQTAEMAAVFEDPTRTALHVVTTPDELSVMETLELLARLNKDHVGPLGVAALNRVPPQLFPNGARAFEPLLADPALQAHARAVLERAQLETMVVDAHARLTAAGLQVIPMEESSTQAFGLADADAMASRLFPPPRVVEAL